MRQSDATKWFAPHCIGAAATDSLARLLGENQFPVARDAQAVDLAVVVQFEHRAMGHQFLDLDGAGCGFGKGVGFRGSLLHKQMIIIIIKTRKQYAQGSTDSPF